MVQWATVKNFSAGKSHPGLGLGLGLGQTDHVADCDPALL